MGTMTISDSSSNLFVINSGWFINENNARNVTIMPIIMTNTVNSYDMISTETTITIRATVFASNTPYASRQAIKTAFNSLTPSTSKSYQLTDSSGEYSYDKVLITNTNWDTSQDIPLGASITIECKVVTTNLTEGV